MKQFVLNDSQNHDIHTYVYQPKTKAKGLVQIIHGASEHFARYGMFAEYLNNHGYIVVGHDILGHGLSTENLDYVHFADKDGDKIAFESIEVVKQWIDANYPQIPHYLLGHSMGSFLARKLVIDYPNAYEKAIFSGTAYPAKPLIFFGKLMTKLISIFKGPRHVSKFIQDISIDANPKKMRKDGIIGQDDEEWLTRDKSIQDYYKHSPMCGQPFSVKANHDMFKWISYVCKKKNIRKANHKQPILLISGGHDALSNYGKDIIRLADTFEALGFTDVNTIIYTDARHEVLNESNKDQVYQNVLDFLNQ